MNEKISIGRSFETARHEIMDLEKRLKVANERIAHLCSEERDRAIHDVSKFSIERLSYEPTRILTVDNLLSV
jgi:hypothetical protein